MYIHITNIYNKKKDLEDLDLPLLHEQILEIVNKVYKFICVV